MNSGVIEFRFDCDEASEGAEEIFNRMMGVDCLLGDWDAVYKELSKQIRQVTKRSPLTVVRIREAEPNPCWGSLWANLLKEVGYVSRGSGSYLGQD